MLLLLLIMIIIFFPTQSLLLISPAGYSVAGGEFSGDDEEGEGHIYCTVPRAKMHGWVQGLRTPHPKLCLKLLSLNTHDCVVTERDY